MIDFSRHLKTLAGPTNAGETKTAIDRAAKASGLAYWRAFDIWYGKARRIEHHEGEAILRAVQEKSVKGQANVIQQLQTELARLQSIHAQASADLDRQELDRMRSGLGSMGRDYGALDRAVAGRR